MLREPNPTSGGPAEPPLDHVPVTPTPNKFRQGAAVAVFVLGFPFAALALGVLLLWWGLVSWIAR